MKKINNNIKAIENSLDIIFDNQKYFEKKYIEDINKKFFDLKNSFEKEEESFVFNNDKIFGEKIEDINFLHEKIKNFLYELLDKIDDIEDIKKIEEEEKKIEEFIKIFLDNKENIEFVSIQYINYNYDSTAEIEYELIIKNKIYFASFIKEKEDILDELFCYRENSKIKLKYLADFMAEKLKEIFFNCLKNKEIKKEIY